MTFADTFPRNYVVKLKKLNLNYIMTLSGGAMAQLIEITHFPDRHFWHRGYDKAFCAQTHHIFFRPQPLTCPVFSRRG